MKRFNTHIIIVSGQATPNVLAVVGRFGQLSAAGFPR